MKTDLPKAIICDLDGTLAIIDHRSPFDASTAMDDLLNLPVANVIDVYSHQKEVPVSLFLVSGRDD
ncbi:polynucleotide kinase, partial [Candidatus Saccharibacteria bacterium]